MPVELPASKQRVLFVPRDEVLEFRSEAQARAFLARFLHDPMNLAEMRRALALQCSAVYVARLDDHEVLDEVARRLVGSCVGLVRVEVPPMTTPDSAGADAVASELAPPDEPLVTDEESPIEDVPPDPIIPPEYIRLARRETDAVETETDRYSMMLDLLRFVGLPGAALSVVAEELVEVAGRQGTALEDATQGAGLALRRLVAGEGLPGDHTDIGPQLRQMAEGQGRKLADAAGRTGDALAGLAGRPGDAPGRSDAAPELRELGRRQADDLVERARGQGGSAFEGLAPDPDAADRAPATGPQAVGFVLRDADGRPVARQKFRITLEDGTVRTGFTDAQGKAKIDHLPLKAKGVLELPGFELAWRDAEGQLPPPTIHVVKRGDWLSKIAEKYGFSDWREIYDHPGNAAFRLERPDPNLIHPGDRIFIPDREPRRLEIEVGAALALLVVGLENADALPDALPEPAGPGGEAEAPGVEEPPDGEVPAGEPPADEVAAEPEEALPADNTPGEDTAEDYFLLLDTETGLVYRVHREMYEEMLAAHRDLANIRKGIKDALKLPEDQRDNAVRAKIEDLRRICDAQPDLDPDSKVHPAPEGRRRRRIHQYEETGYLREFISLHSKEFVYTPAKTQEELEQRFKDRWKLDELKNAAQVREEEEVERRDKGVRFEIKFESEWKGQGEGSLMDFIDSHDPSMYLPLIIRHPAAAPAVLVDWVAEKYPTLLRKNHQGEWEWSKESKYFEGKWEARFLRWAWEAQALEAVWAPRQGEVRIAGKVAGSVSLFTGKTELSWMLPDKDGLSLGVPTRPGHETDFKLRFKLGGTVSGFVGATAELFYEAIADWSVKGEAKEDSKCPVEVGLGGGLNAFAGASVTGELAISVEWFNIESKKWKPFVKVFGQATGFAGVALQFAFRIGWDPQRGAFVFEYKMGLALKVGAGWGIKGEANVNEILTFIGELLTRVDFHRIQEIAGDAFERYWKLCVGTAVEAVDHVTDTVWDVADRFLDWTGEQAEIRRLAENINAGRAETLLKFGSPEAKAAVIAKLCDRSMILSDEPEEEAIVKVLESIPTRRGLIKTLERVVPGDKRVQAGIDRIDDCVDWAEQERFDQILESKGLQRGVDYSRESKAASTLGLSVRIEHLDRPLADEPFRVKLPDGRTLEGRLDDAGAANVEVPDGDCVVVFPRRGPGALRAPSGGIEPIAPELPDGVSADDVEMLAPVRRREVFLRRPRRGPPVEALQRCLNAAGQSVSVDGVYGRDTRAAVRAFQEAHGLEADGLVGPGTMGALDEALGLGVGWPCRGGARLELELRRFKARQVTARPDGPDGVRQPPPDGDPPDESTPSGEAPEDAPPPQPEEPRDARSLIDAAMAARELPYPARRDENARLAAAALRDLSMLDEALRIGTAEERKAVALAVFDGYARHARGRPRFANHRNFIRLVRLMEAVDPNARVGDLARFMRRFYYTDGQLQFGVDMGDFEPTIARDLEYLVQAAHLKPWQVIWGPLKDGFHDRLDIAHSLVALDAAVNNADISGRLRAWVFTDFGDWASEVASWVGMDEAGNANPDDLRGNEFGEQLFEAQWDHGFRKLSELLEHEFHPSRYLA